MLKTQNLERQQEGTEIQEQIQILRVVISERDQEIRGICSQIQLTVGDNQSCEREIEILRSNIQDQQGVRSRQ